MYILNFQGCGLFLPYVLFNHYLMQQIAINFCNLFRLHLFHKMTIFVFDYKFNSHSTGPNTSVQNVNIDWLENISPGFYSQVISEYSKKLASNPIGFYFVW